MLFIRIKNYRIYLFRIFVTTSSSYIILLINYILILLHDCNKIVNLCSTDMRSRSVIDNPADFCMLLPHTVLFM